MSSLNMPCPPDVYRRRRAKLAAVIKRPMVMAAGHARSRNYPANTYPFRADSTYLYFGGPRVQGAGWIIEPGSDGDAGSTLVRPVMGFDDVVWVGEVPSDAELAAAAGVGVKNLCSPEEAKRRLSGTSASYIPTTCPHTSQGFALLRLQPATPEEKQPIIDLRLIKDELELKAMRFAAKVSVEAFTAAMKTTKPGRREAEVAAALAGVFTAHNCEPSFPALVSIHGEVLHPDGYKYALRAGRLLLIDSGAEEQGGYCSDITRTVPVDGKFTTTQRQLYDTVLRAQKAAIAACVPGRRFRDIHDLAAKTICEGLVGAGLLKGDPADLAARGAHTLFFVHGLGHLVGLDVHDMEDYGDQAGYAPGRTRRTQFGSKFLRLDRDLAPGMVLTIEPGIYLVPAIWQNADLVAPFKDVINRSTIEALLKDDFGGIRIEDTVHVRSEGGPEVLTGELPKEPDAVCAVVGGG